jgi:hypothetical protein
VDEVPAGLECGLGVDDFASWQEGDAIDCFMVGGVPGAVSQCRVPLLKQGCLGIGEW